MKPIAAWPARERAQLRGILTDIDDTLTTEGRLLPEVLAAIARVRASGRHIIAVTGRPTWWAMPLLRLCGFHAVIAENGASAFWLDSAGRMQSWFYADAAVRREQRAQLEAFVPLLQARFPALGLADDAAQRVGDLAFDIGENVAPWPAQEIAALLAFMREHGFFATASSIHAHASLTKFCKQATTERILRDVFDVDDASARAHYAFVGDSGNDAAMFAHYPHAIGVANVHRHLGKLDVPPAYVANAACGAGFIEVVDAVLGSD